MKKFNFKSSFREKLKMLLIAVGLMVTSLTTQVWAYDISANTTVVWDAGKESWTTAQLYIYKSDYNTADNLTRIGATTQFYKLYSNSWNGYSGLIFRKDASWSAQTTDITRSISGTILFTYTGSKNNGKLNWGVTTSAKKATSGTTLYFDNTATQWTQPRFKYGTSSFNRYFDMVAVPGTANLWKYTLPNDVYYWKYMVSQDFGWTDYNTIEDTHCNNYTAYQTTNLSSATTLIPSTNGKPCTTETLSGYTRSVTITSPSNGTITVTYTDVDESSKTKTSGSFNVAQTCIITVTATPNTGYVLSSLTIGGASFTSGNTYIVRANTTISASFVAETTHDVAVSYICTDTETAVKAGGSVAVGETTASTFEAGTPNGYSFTRWVVGNGLTITSGSTTSNSISVKTKSTGTYTLKAEYTEVLTTSWYISGATGSGSPFSGLTTSGTAMTKKHGYSAIEKYYCTISVSTVASGSGYSFTPYNSSNSRKYGNANANITKANNSATVYSDNSTDLHFLPYVAGDYEFELDNTGANPVLTVTWPVYNQVRISAASPTADATNVGNFDLGAAVSNVRSVTRSLKANDTYTFKVVSNSEWYGYNSGAFTRSTSTSSNSLTTSTSGGDMTLTTDYAGDYTFKFNESTKALSVDFPEAYQVTYGKGSVNGSTGTCSAIDLDNGSASVTSNSTWVLSGHKVKLTAPNAKAGYTWKGWYGNNSGTGDAISVNQVCTLTVNSSKTAYACYMENNYTVTVNAGAGGTVASGSVIGHKDTKVTLPTATPTVGYYFTGWTTTTGSVTYTNQSSASAAQVNGLTAAATVQANFKPIWKVLGSDEIGGWATTNDANPISNVSSNLGYVDIALEGNKTYTFKLYNQQDGAWFGLQNATSYTFDASVNKSTWQTSAATLYNSDSGTPSGPNNFSFKTGGKGTYRFYYNISTHSFYLKCPASYKVTFGRGTGGATLTASASTTGTITTGQYVASGENITFSQTVSAGYTFSNWYTTKDTGGSVVSGMGPSDNVLNSIAANATVYSRYTANQYAITLTRAGETGYGSGGTASVTATYNAALPNITTLPTAANGYGFMGYFTDHNGEGTQYYGADGSKLVSKYTTVGPLTLYAYFKRAEITSLTFKNNNVVTSPPVFPADANKITVTAALEPTPAGSTHIDWRMLHGNDNPLDDQPSFGTGTTTNQFALPANASGMYKIEAVLRTGTTAGEGTTLSTMVVQFQVAAEHTVTVLYKCGDETIKSSSTVTGKPLEWTEVVAHKIVGYSFSSWTEGDGITLRDTTAARLAELQAADPTVVAVKRMKAIYDGKLTINYTPKRMIYFYNTLNWSNVYVYFYKNDSYWGSSNQGSGANTSWQLTNYPYGEGKHGKMSPVEPGSKIYYFDADSAGVNASYTNVVFTELNQHGCDYFYNNNKVVRRGDYNATTMPLFVPLSDQPAVDKNGKTAKYYCEGYWMNYPANTGYTLRIYDTPGANNATGASREFLIPFSADIKMPLKQDVEINFSGESWFIIYRNDGKYLEGSHTFKQTDHGDKKITSTDNAGTAKKMRLISDGSGIYTFNLSFYGDASSPVNYDYYLSVDFPAAVGDYRIVYKDNATWSNGAHGAQWYHPSDIISKNKSATDAKEDIVSFFISKGAGITPSMKFQRIKSISDASGSYGKITWEDVPSGDITIPTSITSAGVYNFIVSQPAGGASISLVRAEPYTGNYYIRTDCAGETKWNNFRAPDHLMSYSEYSIDHGGYSHYYTHWVQTTDKKNIQFCIANDYSSAISDTLIRESNSVPGWENINTYINSDGDILRNANVRFMWNQSTNKVSRAYVDGAQGVGSNNFLYILSEDSKIRNADESSLVNNKVQFSDKENWIYEAYIQAKPNAAIKLLSNWGESNKITQYFKGNSSSTEKLIGGSGSDFNTIRVLYDFKTNRLIAALVPTSGNYESDNAIEADIMFIREHQGDVAQLTFGDAGKISKIETAYGVMRFNKWTMNNKSKEEGHSPLESPASVYERSLFWISFPFKVKLSEVFGFGTYGEHWAVQRYDGADRAARGHFQENGSFWKWMNRSTEYLEPNQGYLLAIDADLLTEDGGMWPNNIQNLELFFPSYGKMPDITSADVSQTIPTHTCEIDWATTKGLPRTNDPRTSYDRTIFDSHWNVISVPTYVNTDDVTFANTTWTAAGKMGPKFLYTWNADDNTITATTASGYTYHAMHAYMTQYCGGITWSAKSGSPASVVARRAYADEPKEIEFNIELQQNEKTIDRAFVVLSADEEVSAGFAFGEDMTKEFNASRSAIYTFIPDVAAVAGNTLPMSDQTTVVPVGVDIIAEGEYIISLPEGTSGVGVMLIDNELQTRTNLALTDYAVTLPVGTYDERFVLEISPIEPISTNVETVTGDGLPVTGVCKKLIDGVLYIVKDGKVFDARGARIQ